MFYFLCSNLRIHEGHDHDVTGGGGTEQASDQDVLPLPGANIAQFSQYLVLFFHPKIRRQCWKKEMFCLRWTEENYDNCSDSKNMFGWVTHILMIHL